MSEFKVRFQKFFFGDIKSIICKLIINMNVMSFYMEKFCEKKKLNVSQTHFFLQKNSVIFYSKCLILEGFACAQNDERNAKVSFHYPQ